jgi:GTP-binding protein HflX
VHKLEAELREVRRHRATQGKARKRSGVAHVVIVGYTNAGKSTLENRLTDAGVLVEDRLFATLDPTTRKLSLPGGETVLLTDTVGFVRKLPHELVEAFKTTLSVVPEADLLVHVVDGSAPDPAAEIAVVRAIMGEIGAADRPELLVYNKADVSPEAARLAAADPAAVAISAATGLGIDSLLDAIGDRLRSQRAMVELHIPWDRGDVIASVHTHGEVVSEVSNADGMVMRTRLPEEQRGRFAEFERPAEVA